jgi:hypothetical protein
MGGSTGVRTGERTLKNSAYLISKEKERSVKAYPRERFSTEVTLLCG